MAFSKSMFVETTYIDREEEEAWRLEVLLFPDRTSIRLILFSRLLDGTKMLNVSEMT